MNIGNIAVLDENNIITNILVIDVDNFTKDSNHIVYKDENPVFIGGDYFEGKFYPPRPYPSWIRNKDKGEWEAPVSVEIKETDNVTWDEEKQEWISIGKWNEEKNTYTLKGWNHETQEWEDSIIQRYNGETKEYITEVIKDLPLTKE
jgi:hypothetical protein